MAIATRRGGWGVLEFGSLGFALLNFRTHVCLKIRGVSELEKLNTFPSTHITQARGSRTLLPVCSLAHFVSWSIPLTNKYWTLVLCHALARAVGTWVTETLFCPQTAAPVEQRTLVHKWYEHVTPWTEARSSWGQRWA